MRAIRSRLAGSVRGQVHGVQQLVGGQGAFAPAGHELVEQVLPASGEVRAEMTGDDPGELLGAGHRKLKPQAAAQESGRELTLAVARQDDERERLAQYLSVVQLYPVPWILGQHAHIRRPVSDPGQLRDGVSGILENVE